MDLDAKRLENADLVKVVGEVDINTVEEVEEFFADLQAQNLIVDLTEVTFMDTSGIHILVTQLNRVNADDGKMTLVVTPNSSVQLLIKLTGLSDQFTIVDSKGALIG